MKHSLQSEIRHSVIQFTEITGFEHIENPLDPEVYAALISDIARIHDQAIQLYQGHVDKHEGKVFMATFGVPTTHEDDPERAIRAAQLIVQKVNAYSKENKLGIGVRIGLSLGKVYAGDVGSDIKKEYTVIGDAVNIAARIMEHATESCIAVNKDIYQITRPVFKFSEPVEFTVHEITEPIHAYYVAGMRTGFIRRRGIEGLKSPLVGRVHELAMLQQHIENLLDKKGSTIILLGEAGVGKSRIIEELFTTSLSLALEKAKAINWCSGYCSPYQEAIYLPFIHIIKQICGIENTDTDKQMLEKLHTHIVHLVSDKTDEVFPYLANLLNLESGDQYAEKLKYLEPQAIKLQTHVAITALFKSYAKKQPCVYVIDDLYLADMETLEALQFFLETKHDAPYALILISRPDKEKAFWKIRNTFIHQESVHEIVLRRLNKKNTMEVSEHLLKIPRLPAALVNDIVTTSDGNPFFLEEIIKLLIAKGILYKKGQEWLATGDDIDFSIPYTIESVIRTRLDTMNTTLKNTLEEMSVIGRTFSKKMLRVFTTQWEHLDDFISEITELGFVTTENEEDYQFNHALVREVIYSSIPEKRKKALHLKVGETIEALYKDRLPEFYEILFEHFSQTEQHEKTIDYGLKAAENAQKRYANYEAILMYCAVLKELGTLGGNEAQRRQVLIALGKIHNRIGKSDDAFEFYQQALQHCANDLQEAEIYRYIADNYYTISDYNNALESYNKALDKISDPKSLKHYGVQLGIAWVQYLQGEYEKPRVLLVSILDQLADTTDLETRTIQARIYNILASIYTNLDKQSTSFEYYNKALKLYEILDDISGQAVIYNNMCGYYDDIGDHHKALENLEKSLEIETQTGNMLGQAITTYNIGNTYYLLGDFDKAAENFNSYMSLNASINNHLGNGYGNWGFGLISMQQDDYAKAFKYLNKAFSIFKELKSARMETDVKMTIAELNYLQKRYADSWNMCEDIIKCCKESQTSDMIRQARLLMAKIRIAQAIENKKLSITFFDEAKKILIDLLASITDPQEAKEEQFEIQACLTRVCYYLGISEDMMKYLSKAEAIQKELVQFMPDQSSREKFLSRRMYREFNQFRTETQL